MSVLKTVGRSDLFERIPEFHKSVVEGDCWFPVGDLPVVSVLPDFLYWLFHKKIFELAGGECNREWWYYDEMWCLRFDTYRLELLIRVDRNVEVPSAWVYILRFSNKELMSPCLLVDWFESYSFVEVMRRIDFLLRMLEDMLPGR
jgi:hypothetical protein